MVDTKSCTLFNSFSVFRNLENYRIQIFFQENKDRLIKSLKLMYEKYKPSATTSSTLKIKSLTKINQKLTGGLNPNIKKIHKQLSNSKNNNGFLNCFLNKIKKLVQNIRWWWLKMMNQLFKILFKTYRWSTKIWC